MVKPTKQLQLNNALFKECAPSFKKRKTITKTKHSFVLPYDVWFHHVIPNLSITDTSSLMRVSKSHYVIVKKCYENWGLLMQLWKNETLKFRPHRFVSLRVIDDILRKNITTTRIGDAKMIGAFQFPLNASSASIFRLYELMKHDKRKIPINPYPLNQTGYRISSLLSGSWDQRSVLGLGNMYNIGNEFCDPTFWLSPVLNHPTVYLKELMVEQMNAMTMWLLDIQQFAFTSPLLNTFFQNPIIHSTKKTINGQELKSKYTMSNNFIRIEPINIWLILMSWFYLEILGVLDEKEEKIPAAFVVPVNGIKSSIVSRCTDKTSYACSFNMFLDHSDPFKAIISASYMVHLERLLKQEATEVFLEKIEQPFFEPKWGFGIGESFTIEEKDVESSRIYLKNENGEYMPIEKCLRDEGFTSYVTIRDSVAKRTKRQMKKGYSEFDVVPSIEHFSLLKKTYEKERDHSDSRRWPENRSYSDADWTYDDWRFKLKKFASSVLKLLYSIEGSECTLSHYHLPYSLSHGEDRNSVMFCNTSKVSSVCCSKVNELYGVNHNTASFCFPAPPEDLILWHVLAGDKVVINELKDWICFFNDFDGQEINLYVIADSMKHNNFRFCSAIESRQLPFNLFAKSGLTPTDQKNKLLSVLSKSDYFKESTLINHSKFSPEKLLNLSESDRITYLSKHPFNLVNDSYNASAE